MPLNAEDIPWTRFFAPLHATADESGLEALHERKCVLITGAGGSIGSALAQKIRTLHPRKVVLLDSCEQNLYRIHTLLSPAPGSEQHVPILGSVADERCVADLFERCRPEIVYHVAAFKHVSLMEMNPYAVVQNNMFGTSTAAMMARRFGVSRLIMASTDKAVNPRSIMGASKRLAEIILSALSCDTTRMTCIRLGNVLASEGSVVPLFLEQIAQGGPVTVTHPEVERYFLTMEETVRRILSAAAACPADGAIAVPLMGKPVRIADLARFLIEQSGRSDVAISYTGLRPGDKLQEEFVSKSETISSHPENGLQWVDSLHPDNTELVQGLAALDEALRMMNLSRLLTALTNLVPQYEPSAYLLDQVAAGTVR